MSSPQSSDPRDPYSRVNYRRLIAWGKRIEREWPLLDRVLGAGPSKRVLDLGSGTGEHCRFMAEHGFEVVGVDASESMIGVARDEDSPGVTFVHGDIRHLEELVEGSFGSALCLGNTLPHLLDPEDLRLMATGLRRCLEPGGALLLQLLNYDRVFDGGLRYLPVNFRPPEEGEQGEIVFLRLMDPRPDGSVVFLPSTLLYRRDGEPPLELLSSRRVRLRGWRRPEVLEALREAGFQSLRTLGSFAEDPFDSATSPDLIVVAR